MLIFSEYRGIKFFLLQLNLSKKYVFFKLILVLIGSVTLSGYITKYIMGLDSDNENSSNSVSQFSDSGREERRSVCGAGAHAASRAHCARAAHRVRRDRVHRPPRAAPATTRRQGIDLAILIGTTRYL